ncbi:trypsin-like peptidase domain-containing protein [Bacteroidales bacterium AH-315-I05]|nr:trypsin-like peptidase domain-containing protein [Bacteroidales bacterium AH-315-I05]
MNKHKDAVVLIETYNKDNKLLKLGTGFFIDKTGVAVSTTNIFADAASAKIKTADGSEYSIKEIINADENAGLVLFSLNETSGKEFSSLTANYEKPKKDQEVFILGNPFVLQNGVSKGKIKRTREIIGYGNSIQITAPVSPGSSGSPVLDMSGKVIGITTIGLVEGENLNFAIDINQLKNLGKKKAGNIRFLSDEEGENTGVDYEYYFLKAIVARDTNDWIMALYYFSKELERNPKNAEAYFHRGITRFRLDDIEDAFENLNKAIKLNENMVAAYIQRGIIKLSITDFDGAFSDFNRAIVLDPKNAMAYYNKGQANMTVKNYKAATKDFVKALKFDPKFKDSWYQLALAEIELKKYDDAIIDFGKVIELDVENAEAYFFRGNAKRRNNNTQDACTDWQKAFEFGYPAASESIAAHCKK